MNTPIQSTACGTQLLRRPTAAVIGLSSISSAPCARRMRNSAVSTITIAIRITLCADDEPRFSECTPS